jgi:nucleoside 2-deoxyribosyltransferase
MRYVFIIGPVGSDPLFREKQRVVQEVATQYGLTVFLPLEAATEHGLVDIILTIRSAEFVLVDLSFERPSCYYELGVAQALGSPIEVIAEAGTRIHQLDNRSVVEFYSGLERYGELLRAIFAERYNGLLRRQ